MLQIAGDAGHQANHATQIYGTITVDAKLSRVFLQQATVRFIGR